MIYNLISSRTILSKVLADLDLKEEPQRVSDIMEWCSEAVEKIGSVKQLNRKVSGVDGEPFLAISGNQAKLPQNLFRLNQIAYSTNGEGPWFPMKVSTSSFNVWSSNLDVISEDGIPMKDSELIDTVKILYSKYVEDPIYSWFSKMDNKAALELLNTNANARILLSNLIKRNTSNPPVSQLQYSIKPGYITTNAPYGYIKISYDAIPIDEYGYALIPDNISYIEAIYWYVVMKLSYSEYRTGKIRQDVYYDAKRSWNFYCKQAYAESIMPTQDDMETIKNVWIKLVPDMNSDSDFYDSLSEKENIFNQNRR